MSSPEFWRFRSYMFVLAKVTVNLLRKLATQLSPFQGIVVSSVCCVSSRSFPKNEISSDGCTLFIVERFDFTKLCICMVKVSQCKFEVRMQDQSHKTIAQQSFAGKAGFLNFLISRNRNHTQTHAHAQTNTYNSTHIRNLTRIHS